MKIFNCKKAQARLKMLSTKCVYKSYIYIYIYIYIYKQDLALNDLEWLICQKTHPNQTEPILISKAYTPSYEWNLKSLKRFHSRDWTCPLKITFSTFTIEGVRVCNGALHMNYNLENNSIPNQILSSASYYEVPLIYLYLIIRQIL